MLAVAAASQPSSPSPLVVSSSPAVQLDHLREERRTIASAAFFERCRLGGTFGGGAVRVARGTRRKQKRDAIGARRSIASIGETTSERAAVERAAASSSNATTARTYPLEVRGAVDLTQRLGAALERLRVERRRHRLLVILHTAPPPQGGDGSRPEREARADADTALRSIS